jgi:hypothetical protein
MRAGSSGEGPGPAVESAANILSPRNLPVDAFRLRDMLLVTVLAAVSFCVLVAPSPGWLGPMIFGVMVAIAIAVQRAVASPVHRPVWVSLLVGVLSYLSLMLVCLAYLEGDAITGYIGEPWWSRRYGEVPRNNDHPEYGAYATFLIALHIVFGGAAATMAARVAQFVCRGSAKE